MPATDTHAPSSTPGRAYCGRKTTTTTGWKSVTCADCHAAHRADQEKR